MTAVVSYPPLSRRRVNALGIDTNYYEAGERDGRPIIFLHGMSTSGDSFRELMHDLAADHWLLAPDIPGFGYSENTAPYTMAHLNEWLAAFIDVLALPPVYLAGHSFGGLLAVGYALAYPEDVRGLLLMAPALLAAQEYPDWAKSAGQTLDFLGMIDLGVAVSQSQVMVKRQIRAAFYAPERLPASLWERRLVDYENSRASAAVLKAAARYDLTGDLRQLDTKVWIIWGKHDPVLDPTHADQLADLLPDAPVFVLPDCGHVPMLEQRPRVVEIIRAFMAEEVLVKRKT